MNLDIELGDFLYDNYDLENAKQGNDLYDISAFSPTYWAYTMVNNQT